MQRNQFVNDQCPASADITYYAAVYGNESIVIFGSALESEVEEDGRESYWFVDISFPIQDLQITMRGNRLDPFVLVQWERRGEKKSKKMYRNLVYSKYGIEWELALSDIDFGWNPANTRAMEVKISTSFTKTKSDICDETTWFEPLEF